MPSSSARAPSRRRGRWIAAFVVLALLLLLGGAALRRGDGNANVPIARVERGDLAIEVSSVGELQAVHALSFGVPRLRGSPAKVVWLIAEGSRVAAGDTLARFDPSEVLRRIEDLESRLTSARANLQKMHASQAAQISEMEAALEDQRAAVRLAEIGAAGIEYEAAIDRERTQLELQRARLAVQQAESKLESHRNIHAAELTEQQVTIGQLESQLTTERETLKNHVVVAPTSGLVVYGSHWSGGRQVKVKIGDQLYYGGEVIELPDLSSMQVESWVNESRVDQLRIGLPCEVRIDAFPDTTYAGSITRVNVLGRELPESEGVKVFDYVVEIEGSDPRLRPGMTASVLARVTRLDDVVYAPIEAVHLDDAGSWVFRKRGRKFERVPVTLGERNDFHVVLTSGVEVGDEVALRVPGAEEGGGD
jgi:multidrug efflux pump subunit AcrA (membrane-fusion protein)